MTQGFPGYGAPTQQPQQFAPPQGYAPPAQPQFAPPPQAPQYQQGMGAAPGGFFQTQDPHIQAQQGPAVPPAPQHQPQQQTDTAGFFGGAAAISFDDKKGYVRGTPRGGQVLSKTISNQTKMGTGEVLTWGDGTPRKQMVVTLQTAERVDPNDNGQRQLFIKGDLPRAVREAFQAVGASDVEVGGWLYAAWVDTKPAKAAGYNPQKIYKAVYAKPGSPDPLAGQPAFTPSPVPAPSPVPTPQPSAGPDQFAAHADYQAQQAAYAAQMAQQPQFAPPQAPAPAQQFAPQPGAQAPAPQAPAAPQGQPAYNPFGA